MAHLIAQGEQPSQRWRRVLPPERPVVLGRAAGSFSVPWDDRISRNHAELCWRNGRLDVRRLPETRNPIFVKGTERDTFSLPAGNHFVIGQTTFTLLEEEVDVSLQLPAPLHERTFSAAELAGRGFHDARERIDVLSRLPEVIAGAASDDELGVRLTSLLLAGVTRAEAVALVRGDEQGPIEVLHWDRRVATANPFRPSERLIRVALAGGSSVLHLWGRGGEPAFTVGDDIDWAFCTPVGGSAARDWGIYVAGRFPAGPVTADDDAISDDLKFTEVAAATLRNLRALRALERRQAGLRQFFSPPVLAALADADPDTALAPREAEVTVLFCDLRGFSRASEEAADDLLGLLDRVSQALGVTTRHILERDGVVGDFQGDAVMGFWGWPLADPNKTAHACAAALAIRGALARAAGRSGDRLAGFQLGIGIATGMAVAGKLGTVDQVQVTAFGPVVNIAARLEGLTKQAGTPILMDGPTARVVAETFAPDVARVRPLARVRPAGMTAAVEVSELLGPEEEPGGPTAEQLTIYAEALAAFEAGDWTAAAERLARLPDDDPARRFLAGQIDRHDGRPPVDWEGIVTLERK